MSLIKLMLSSANIIGNPLIIQKSFENLYPFKVFRHIINGALCLAQRNELSFEVVTQTFADTNEGVCITHKGSNKQIHLVKIRQNQPHLVIHEISHAIEKSFRINLDKSFLEAIKEDLKQIFQNNSNFLARTVIEKVLLKEVSGYEECHRPSEFFARVHEIFAMTQEINPQNKECFIKMSDLQPLFKKTINWINSEVVTKVNKELPEDLKTYSNSKPYADANIEISWANKIPKKGTKYTY